MKQKAMLLVLVFVLSCPAYALGADFNWILTWQGDQTLTEVIVTDTPELLSQDGEWQAVAGQENTFTRCTDNWEAYNQRADRLPVGARTKNYLVTKRTKISTDEKAEAGGSTFANLNRAGAGQVKIEAPGFILKTKSAVKGQWSKGFTASWNVAQLGEGRGYNFSMQVMTIEIIPSILVVLVIAWGTVWIIYRRQVRRMEQLIAERYSLDSVVRAELPEEAQAEAGEQLEENGMNAEESKST